jgi:hypothetical protein
VARLRQSMPAQRSGSAWSSVTGRPRTCTFATRLWAVRFATRPWAVRWGRGVGSSRHRGRKTAGPAARLGSGPAAWEAAEGQLLLVTGDGGLSLEAKPAAGPAAQGHGARIRANWAHCRYDLALVTTIACVDRRGRRSKAAVGPAPAPGAARPSTGEASAMARGTCVTNAKRRPATRL